MEKDKVIQIIILSIAAIFLVIIYFLQKHKERILPGDIFILRYGSSSLKVVVIRATSESVSYTYEKNIGKGLQYIMTDPLRFFYHIAHAERVDRDTSFVEKYNILNEKHSILTRNETKR